jgi:hypothetical protein
MIWHIFRKDWKLLWPIVVGLTLVNLIQRVILSRSGPLGIVRISPWTIMSGFFGEVLLLATAVLVVVVVQQDAIPGLRQDWLVRPIRRRDLLLAKMLFVVLLVQGSIFLGEVIQALGAGFSLEQSLAVPLSRSVWMVLAVDLPLLAFATLTRNLMETIGAAVVVGLGFSFFMTSTLAANPASPNETGFSWVVDSMRGLWSVLVVGIILALQYFRRKTIRARWLYGSAGMVWLFAQLLPWQAAFAVQERLSPQPAAANPIQILFEPGSGRAPKLERGVMSPRFPFKGAGDVVLWLPLHAGSVGANQMLIAEHVTARITEAGGKVSELGNEREANFYWVHRWDRYKPLWVPEDIYKRVKDRPARLEIDYSLTLLRANDTWSMSAPGGELRTPDLGWCATGKGLGGIGIELRCLKPGPPPSCFNARLESPETGAWAASQEPECQPNYAPYVGRLTDSIGRFGTRFPMRDSSGLPIAAESLMKNARMVIQAYRPEAYFTRQVVVTDIRLSDWRAE